MNAVKTLLLLMAVGSAFGFAQADAPGLVYIETNSSTDNQVQVYSHGFDGALSLLASFSTGGYGTGAGLGSQGAVVMSDNGRFLYAVDAGSNDLAVFAVSGRGLRRIGRYGTGGTMPISVTAKQDLVYVVNAGGAGNIAGLRSRADGRLDPISSSFRTLSGEGVGPAQIQFSPQGDLLVVTEKGTNTIDTWPIHNGRPGALVTSTSSGATPFGFDFDTRGHLIVSEAAGGAAGASSASSYRPFQGHWSPISASAPTHQTAACWLAVSPNGRFAYTANAGSGTISGFSISRDGGLTLLMPNGLSGDTGSGSHPVDMGFNRSGRFLYVLANGNGSIAEFRVSEDGSLTPIGTVTGLPLSAQGLATG